MTETGINYKRLFICLILGAIGGLICAFGTLTLGTISRPVTIEVMLYIIYNRVVLGLVIGLIGHIQFVDNENVNPIIRGAIFGCLISIIMIIIPEIATINYLATGIVFGILIDSIASKLAPEE